MLHDFLLEHEIEILKMTESRTQEISGVRPSSVQLKKGLPIFYKQLLTVLLHEEVKTEKGFCGRYESSRKRLHL